MQAVHNYGSPMIIKITVSSPRSPPTAATVPATASTFLMECRERKGKGHTSILL